MSTTSCEKDSLSGQRVLPPEPRPFFGRTGFFPHPLCRSLYRIMVSCQLSVCRVVGHHLVGEILTDLGLHNISSFSRQVVNKHFANIMGQSEICYSGVFSTKCLRTCFIFMTRKSTHIAATTLVGLLKYCLAGNNTYKR